MEGQLVVCSALGEIPSQKVPLSQPKDKIAEASRTLMKAESPSKQGGEKPSSPLPSEVGLNWMAR